MKGLFEGTLLNKIISLEEEYTFENEIEEPFMTLTLEIKNVTFN